MNDLPTLSSDDLGEIVGGGKLWEQEVVAILFPDSERSDREFRVHLHQRTDHPFFWCWVSPEDPVFRIAVPAWPVRKIEADMAFLHELCHLFTAELFPAEFHASTVEQAEAAAAALELLCPAHVWLSACHPAGRHVDRRLSRPLLHEPQVQEIARRALRSRLVPDEMALRILRGEFDGD